MLYTVGVRCGYLNSSPSKKGGNYLRGLQNLTQVSIAISVLLPSPSPIICKAVNIFFASVFCSCLERGIRRENFSQGVIVMQRSNLVNLFVQITLNELLVSLTQVSSTRE